MSTKIEVEFGTVIQGFRYDNKQPQFQLKLRLEMPRVFYKVDAKKLLETAFDITNSGSLNIRRSIESKLNDQTKELVSTANAIAQSLLIHGGFPALDKAILKNFYIEKTKPRRVSVVLMVPTEKFQNHKLVAQAYIKGLKIAQAFTVQKPLQAEMISNSTKELDEFVKNLRRHTQAGVSTKFIVQEAFARDLPIMYRAAGHYQIGLGNKQRVFLRSATLQDSAIGASITNDKYNCIQQLKAAGIPTPISQRVRSADEAKEAAAKLGFPVVLKPSNLDRGEGVFVDVHTNKGIETAIAEIQKLSQRIIIENRVQGICHRLLVFRDEVVFAFARHPLSVVGDGKSNIARLISVNADNQKNKAPHLRKTISRLDSEAQAQLDLLGFCSKTVLNKGQIAHLRPFQSLISGGHNEILTTSVHPANAEIACRAARMFDLEVAGIDLISTDITVPWYENDAAINEVNFQPQIGENTARAIMDQYFPDQKGHIPIECFIGDGAALISALERHKHLCAQGDKAFLTSHDISIGSNQSEIFLAGINNLFGRVECFLKDPRVSTLIVVVQTDEVTMTGLPFSKITSLQITNENLKSIDGAPDRPIGKKSKDTIELLTAALSR